VTFGVAISRKPSRRTGRAGMSLKFQITSVLPALTLYDNILLALQAQTSLPSLLFSGREASCTIVSWPCSNNSAW